MKKSPKQAAMKLQTIIDAWKKLRPAKQFAGMTVEQFAEKVKPSLDTRDQLSGLRRMATDSRLQRVNSDAASLGFQGQGLRVQRKANEK